MQLTKALRFRPFRFGVREETPIFANQACRSGAIQARTHSGSGRAEPRGPGPPRAAPAGHPAGAQHPRSSGHLTRWPKFPIGSLLTRPRAGQTEANRAGRRTLRGPNREKAQVRGLPHPPRRPECGPRGGVRTSARRRPPIGNFGHERPSEPELTVGKDPRLEFLATCVRRHPKGGAAAAAFAYGFASPPCSATGGSNHTASLWRAACALACQKNREM